MNGAARADRVAGWRAGMMWLPRFRTGLLVIAALAAGEVAMVLARRGPDYLNLQSLRDEPVTFLASIVVPALLSAGCLLAAILPRTLTINLAVLLVLLAGAEATARVLALREPAVTGTPEIVGTSVFYLPSPTLGFVLPSSVTARHEVTRGDVVMFDATYRMDAFGRRLTPVDTDAGRSASLLFFGDSNTFGWGLEQDQTLPYYAGKLAPSYRPYNYGVPGYGPTQLLLLAQQRRFRREVTEPDGYAVFFLIPAHIDRVIGSSTVVSSFGRNLAYYQLTPTGELVSPGDFAHGRPLTTLAYFFWDRSALMRRFNLELPFRRTAADYRLLARIFTESRRLLGEQLHLRGFVVVLYQPYTDTQRAILQRVRAALDEERVPYLDYSALLDSADPGNRLFDLHSSPRANQALATRLVADLGIGR